LRRGRLEQRVNEAGAMVSQLGLLFSDWKPSLRGGSGPLVVLIHGLYATAGVLRPIRNKVEQEFGARTFSFSYGFGPGIVELATRLEVYLRGLDDGAPLSRGLFLVGHSVGGLVATYAAQLGPLRGRVRGVVTLAAPFGGSQRAWLVPGQAGRDIEPDHPLLAQLRAVPPGGPGCPQLCVVAEEDTLIVPGALPEYGEHAALDRVGHNGILFDVRTANLVSRTFRAWLESSNPAARCDDGSLFR
jgi:triacylglycerol lipase